MSSTTQWVLIALGIGVCVVLGWFIAKHVRGLQERRRDRQNRESQDNERRRDAIQSVRVLAMSIEQDQVGLAEGAIRIHGLLQVLAPGLLNQEPYSVFRVMAEETAHMPTHERRSQTDKASLRQLDQQRVALEEEHREKLRQAATAIRHHEFS